MMDTGEPHRRLPLFVKEELMNATILHESRGRIRLKLKQERMTLPQADLLESVAAGKAMGPARHRP